MKCGHCSKDIPAGFTDCPWCGESPSTLPRAVVPPAEAAKPAGLSLAAWLVLPLSLTVVTLAAYLATSRKYGSVSLEHAAYFLGACAGPYILAALLVLAYYFVRRKQARDSVKLLATFCVASFFAGLSLIASGPAAHSDPDAAWTTHLNELAANPEAATPHATTVWDPALISLLSDLKSFNEDYVAAVSKLDLDAQPLYTPASFRDAAAMRQMLAQLQQRMAIADQYSSLDPILSKLKTNVAALPTSEQDKQQFLAGLTSGAQQGLPARNAASAYERQWLAASIDLYQFMLANQASYTISPDGQTGAFHRRGLAEEFHRRLQKAQLLKQKFLQANNAFLSSQRVARAQLGLPE
jgi:hypothetical protein